MPLGALSLVQAFALFLILFATGCARKAPAAPPGLFQDVAQASGISFRHSNGACGKYWMIETTGSGCALFDYDNDGRLDVLLVQSGPLPGNSGERRNGLYHNVGKPSAPRFVDVTRGSGLEDTGYGQGAAIGDFDNDGFADVYLTAYGGNHLFRNLGGTGGFEDVTKWAGVGDTDHGPRYATSAAFGDMDNDGRLDLYVCHYCPWTPAINEVCHDTKQQQDYCSPDVYDPEVHRLYRNLGGGRFQDVTRASGIVAGRGRGLAVAWVDDNNDGRQDIYVANDLNASFLWRNEGAGHFRDIAVEAGCAFAESGTPIAGMGIGVADYDNDLREDLFVTNFSGQPNTLYRNLGRGRFADVSMPAGVALPHMKFLSFGCEFFDYDADGWRDLIVANGHVQLRVESSFDGVSYAEPKQMFRNEEGRRFVEIDSQLGDMARPVVSRGLAVGDVDNDGGLDVLVNNQNSAAELFVNRSPRGHWISFRTVGMRSNREGRHARVTITAGGRRQTAQVRAGSSYASHSDPRVYFGLGAAGRVEQVEVRWPSGARDTARDLPADAFYTLTEGRGAAPAEHHW